MGILPVLLIIIVFASIFANYNKIAKQRLEDHKKRMASRQNAGNAVQADGNGSRPVRQAVRENASSEPAQKTLVAPVQPVKPAVSASDMKRAVVMAEILNKPVSMREK